MARIDPWTDDGREAFSALVADIYDAALDPPSWREVLKDICGFVHDGPTACLFWQDAVRRAGQAYYVWGGDPLYSRLYWDKYVRLNPFTAAAGHFPVEEVYSAADILPLPQFFETPFYKEWMIPQGWGDVLSANLDKSATSRAVFSVARHARDGMVDEEMRRRMRLLVPHVRRSAMIGKLINLSRVEAAALADTLDGLQAGMFLVDAAGGWCMPMRAGARCWMPATCCMRTANWWRWGREGDESLREILLAAGNGEAALVDKEVAVRLAARDGDRFVTHVLPLTSGARRQAGVSYAAVAAVFVQKAGHDASPALEMLAPIRPDARRNCASWSRSWITAACRGRVGAEALARDRAHASAPCVREDRRAAAGRSGQADHELSGADPGPRRTQRCSRADGARQAQFVPTPASRRILP